MPIKLYTTNPNERNTVNTVPVPADVKALLLKSWSGLTDLGARTLTAQFLHETGGARYCFNWNLGNVKAGANEPHMYLCGVWELTPKELAAHRPDPITDADGPVRVATEAECKQHGWAHPADRAVLVFDPPHHQCRFRAYDNLADGAARWMSLHRKIAQSHPDYLATVNAGDCAGVAHILKLASYYTGDETVYGRSMQSKLSGVV